MITDKQIEEYLDLADRMKQAYQKDPSKDGSYMFGTMIELFIKDIIELKDKLGTCKREAEHLNELRREKFLDWHGDGGFHKTIDSLLEVFKDV